MGDFVHLHVHSEYSLLDGAARIPKLIARVKALGQEAVALTDHGVMYGAVDFYREAKKQGIKPIIGCEMYVAPTDLHEKEARVREYSHLILLAKNDIGYHNLIKLCSIGFTEGFYYKPRIDYDTLERYSEGLVCLSACLQGDLPQMLLEGRTEEAEALALRLKEMFGEDFYIELQDHGLADQKRVAPRLIALAEHTGIALVVTNDSHYVLKEDAESQNILMCIQMNRFVEDGTLMFGTDEFYLKSGEEMAALFPNYPEAVANTLKIAEKCNVDFDFSKTHLPEFDVPPGYTHEAYLEELARKGVGERYSDPAAVEERLTYELSTINKMGFTDYFLIVQDFVGYAKSHGITVGPGRGSAAGSLVAYALHITDIDPMEYNLLFERFLNPERISMPDIDIDFCDEQRQKVIDYVIEKYGADRVAQIITFGTLGAKQVVRDVGRVLRKTPQESDRIAKMIPFELKMTLSLALERSQKLRAEYQNDPEVQRWLDIAMKLEGMPRHSSTHAAGVVISQKPVTEYVPLAKNPKDESITTQFTMGNLEALGLLKMDFLGLRTLSVIRDCIDMVRERHGVVIDLMHLPKDDQKVYEMITAGDTDGVFQLESDGMRSLMTQLRPTDLGEIMVGIALFRPGPMAKIPDYIAGKNDRAKIRYAHPVLEKCLKETYGCMVYQEQVMELVRDMAGYSLGRSDLVRRAMSKKKADVMEKERKIFVYGGDGVPGAVKRDIPEEVAQHVFDEMMDFAQYAFNKSHACAYAVVAYQTAYLKCYYETEFMTALLNSFIDRSDKLTHYMNCMRQKNIRLLSPDINLSQARFTVTEEGVRFGLSALKQVGDAINEVIAERRNAPFVDFEDFVSRCSAWINKGQVESLILSGSFDYTGAKRAQMMAGYDMIYKNAALAAKRKSSGQMSLFEIGGEEPKTSLPDFPEYEEDQLLALEKEKTGIYISGHPLRKYESLLKTRKHSISEILSAGSDLEKAEYYDGREVELAGILTGLKTRTTKQSRQLMANGVFEDLTGSIGVIFFPKTFSQYESMLAADQLLVVKGKVTIAEDAPPELMAIAVSRFREGAQGKTLFLRLPEEDVAIVQKIKEIAARHPGKSELVIHVAPTKRTYRQGSQIDPCKEAISEMEALLGKENVAIK